MEEIVLEAEAFEQVVVEVLLEWLGLKLAELGDKELGGLLILYCLVLLGL